MSKPPMGMTEHTYLGARGRLVEPRSESGALSAALAMLVEIRDDVMADVANDAAALDLRSRVTAVIQNLQALKAQVGAGYHRNPPLAEGHQFAAGTVVGVIGESVHEIRYTHADNGKDYKHEFESGSVEVWAVERGKFRDLLLHSDDGLPLWQDF